MVYTWQICRQANRSRGFIMRTEDLKYVIEVYKTRSISKAASRLNISSQGLGKAIRAFEDELGCELFTRDHKGVVPTQLCEHIYNDLSEILDRTSKIGRMISDYKSAGKPEYFVMMESVLAGMIGEALAEYNTKYMKNVVLMPLRIPDTEIEKLFEENDYTYKICTKELIKNDRYKTYPLTTLHFHPLVSGTNHLCSKTHITIDDFRGMTLLVEDSTRPYVDYFRKLCSGAGIEVRIKNVYDKFLIAKQLTENNSYIFLGQKADISKMLLTKKAELTVLKFEPAFETNIVVQSKNDSIDPAMLNCIRNKISFFSERYLD